MTLRQQIEALPYPVDADDEDDRLIGRNAVLDIIDQHVCSDDEGEKAAREYVESITVVCTRPHLDDRDAPTLPPPDLALMDTQTERADPDRPVRIEP